jgi:two-component system sensor histidine kinase UhpB
MVNPEWLPVIFEDAFSEIYIVDCATLHLIAVNRSALSNLNYELSALLEMALPDLARNLPPATYRSMLTGIDTGSARQIYLEANHVRADGSTYPIEMHVHRTEHPTLDQPVYIAIGRDLTQRDETARALRLSESRLNAIVSNTPGLVYQFQMQLNGTSTFAYLSEGCQALLGVNAQYLLDDAGKFLELILPDDRASYTAAMRHSAAEKRAWNWVGRIWIEKWNDIKWINLRAIPRLLPDGSVQWEGIMTNITQTKLEEAEIKRSRAQLAELSAHIETVKEQERTRIAREIHDDLGGNLTAIKMSLALLTKRLPPDSALIEKATYLDNVVDRTIEAVHRISGDLRPGILDFGLVAAIEWQAQEFEKQLGITCEFSANQNDITLDVDPAAALFRIFQEALTNITKHAQATHVRVELIYSTQSIKMQITDNGRGIAAGDNMKPKSFGIRGMTERASALGGKLFVTSGPEGGCIVLVKVPLAKAYSQSFEVDDHFNVTCAAEDNLIGAASLKDQLTIASLSSAAPGRTN